MKKIILKIFLLFAFLQLTSILAEAKNHKNKSSQSSDLEQKISTPDFDQIPRLRAGLPVGTIAWVLPEQLHPTQPQTGKREIERKKENLKKRLKDHGKKFSKKLYNFVYSQGPATAYISPSLTVETSRPIVYITDRTHSTEAQSEMIRDLYGEKALTKTIKDSKGLPLNFILVQVMGDKSELSESAFVDFMVRERHCYLKEWSRAKDGTTLVQDINFEDLPQNVWQTTDNPYRGLIGELQSQALLGRTPMNFSQFIDAAALEKANVVSWDEIDLKAGKKTYANAVKKAAYFFSSQLAADLPGALYQTKNSRNIKSCENILL